MGVLYDHPGPPDVLRLAEVPDPVCAPDGVLIRIEAIAIAVGSAVTDRHVGQKVTSFDMGGSHAELRAVAASRTWPIPGGLDMAAGIFKAE
ncbi:Alcohol dehydrogenase, zinc-binding [plant metagenome]|uniref:Alcohol dehydrogenase, zinc-binding n=1 Tax=plant metagenome TaxID=1297885 RepID=A0A484V2L0_9ZZZZ